MTVTPVYDTKQAINELQWLHPMLFDEGWIVLPTEILGIVPVEIAVPEIYGMPLAEIAKVVENQWRQAIAETFGTFPEKGRYWIPGPDSGLRSELREVYMSYIGKLQYGIDESVVSLVTCSEVFAPWRVISTWCPGCAPYNSWVLAPLRFMWSRTAGHQDRYWAPQGATANQSKTASTLHLSEYEWYEAIGRAWKIHESNSGMTRQEMEEMDDDESRHQIEMEFVNEINVATVLAHHDLWSWTERFRQRLEQQVRTTRPVRGLSFDWLEATRMAVYEESRMRLRWNALNPVERQIEIDMGIDAFRVDARTAVA